VVKFLTESKKLSFGHAGTVSILLPQLGLVYACEGLMLPNHFVRSLGSNCTNLWLL